MLFQHSKVYKINHSVLSDKYNFFGQVHNGHLLVPGQVQNFNISTTLIEIV